MMMLIRIVYELKSDEVGYMDEAKLCDAQKKSWIEDCSSGAMCLRCQNGVFQDQSENTQP